MKNKFILGLSLLALAGATHAAATVKSYDFNSIVATGTAASAGTVTLTVGDVSDSKTVASGDAYTLSVTGLTGGKVYAYAVTGADTASGEVILGNETDVLFGASAKTGENVPTGGEWDSTYPTPVVSDHAYVLAGTSNKFNVTTTPSGNIVYIDSEMTFSDGADELEPFEALGAFTLAQTNETVDTDFFWAGLVKKDGDAQWVELEGSLTAGTGTFTSRMEFDLSAKKVRYWVKGETDGFVLLKNGNDEWFDTAANQETISISSVSFEGTGKLAAFEGSSFEAKVAQVGDVKYDSLAAALEETKSASPQATVTLLTNAKLTPSAELNPGKWTMDTGSFDFVRNAAPQGIECTYEGDVLEIKDWVTAVNVAGSTAMGYDFTNGTVSVTVSDSHIQSGSSVSVKVTVKNAAGVPVGEIAAQTVTGDGTYDFAIPGSLEVRGDYTYDIVVTKDAKEIKTGSGAFMAANSANWFSAQQGDWAHNGSWSTNGVGVTVTGAKLELGGNQYDFTPAAPDISNVIVRVDTVIEINGAIDSEDLPTEGDVQGMIALVETEDETPAWQAFDGSTWKTLTGGSTDVGTYTIRAEFDYRETTKKVRYSVAKGGNAFVVLTDNGNEWIANGVQSATTLAGTSAMGAGSLVSLKGDNIDASVAEVDGVRYETMAAALAAAAGKDVKLLWNCTWTPGVNGQWTIDANGKTLIVYGAGGWDFDYENDELQASNVKVAKVGDNEYYLIKKAFAAVTENGTVKMLTNLVQNVDVAVANNAILDLASWFVSGAGELSVGAGKTLVFTNSTGVAGGFGMGVKGTHSICGGKWVGNTGALGSNYKFIELAEKPTVDGVTYDYEAFYTTVPDPTKAKVYPVKDGDNSVGDAVVTDQFVKDNVDGYGTKTPAEIATALNENRTTGNCLPLIQSYILGLDPKVETAKPIVGAVQNADADKVTLSLGALTVNTAAGVPVQFSLSTATAADFSGATESAKQDSSEFNVGIGSNKLQYYKINIHFGK